MGALRLLFRAEFRAPVAIVAGPGDPGSDCTSPINPTDFEVLVVPPGGRPIYKLISGHLPDPSAPDQVLASFTLQQYDGVHLGTVIHVPFYSAAQASAYDNSIHPQAVGWWILAMLSALVALAVVGQATVGLAGAAGAQGSPIPQRW
jgi:hypothetical protein